MMAAEKHDIEHYLALARELAVKVAANADRIDHERQIPPELAGELADKGFFRLLMPHSLGGAELAHPDFLRILEVFAAEDASVAWSLNQNNVFATNSVRIPEETVREIWADPRAVVTNGPPTSATKAVPVDGGYLLSGRWNFSSGCPHATWIAALAPVVKPGQEVDAARNREGARILLMPKSQVKFLDLWHVYGLRGTGSFSFEIVNQFIPAVRTYEQDDPPREPGALYVIPRTLLFASGFSTVALGVARAALDIAIKTAGTRMPGVSRTLLRDRATTHRMIGQAEATWRAAKAFLRDADTAVWESACRNHQLTTDERIKLRLASTHGIRMAAEVMEIAYSLCGAGAIFHANPIQRRFQDMGVMTQHIQGSYAHYDTAGQHFLGLEPEGNF